MPFPSSIALLADVSGATLLTGAPAAGMLAMLSLQIGRGAPAASRSLASTWVELQQMSPALLAHMSMSSRAQQQVSSHLTDCPCQADCELFAFGADMQSLHPGAAVSCQGPVLPLLHRGPLACRCDHPGPSVGHQHCSSRGRVLPLVFSWRLQGWARVCRRPPRTCVLQVSMLHMSCCKLSACLGAVWDVPSRRLKVRQQADQHAQCNVPLSQQPCHA